MKRVDTFGLFHYEISGDREAEAAAVLESKLDQISRDYHSAESRIESAVADARQTVANEFDVEIRAVVG